MDLSDPIGGELWPTSECGRPVELGQNRPVERRTEGRHRRETYMESKDHVSVTSEEPRHRRLDRRRVSHNDDILVSHRRSDIVECLAHTTMQATHGLAARRREIEVDRPALDEIRYFAYRVTIVLAKIELHPTIVNAGQHVSQPGCQRRLTSAPLRCSDHAVERPAAT